MSERVFTDQQQPIQRTASGLAVVSQSARVAELRAQYPNARSTQEDARRASKREADYSSFGVGDPIELPYAEFDLLTERQMRAYLNICRQLSGQYPTNAFLRRYYDRALLQFEPEHIQTLTPSYPVTTFAGSQFASDVMVAKAPDGSTDPKDKFKTVEVNFGPVGGISHSAKSETLHPETVFPITPGTIMKGLLHSVSSYYEQACEQLGKEPKPFNDRNVVLVEHDGWYPGAIYNADALNNLGLNVTIAPREALHFDSEKNRLVYTGTEDNPQEVEVDQVILNYALEDDVHKDPSDKKKVSEGEISKAIRSGAVVAESSIFTQILLSSKATNALIDYMSRHPDSFLARKLEMNPEDLARIAEMFPQTDQWGPAYFDAHGINGFGIREHARNDQLVAKVTNGGTYGGRGVFIFEGSDKKVVQDFSRGLRHATLEVLQRAIDERGSQTVQSISRGLLTAKAETQLVDFLDNNGDIKGTRNERRLKYLFTHFRDAAAGSSEITTYLRDHFRFNDDEIAIFLDTKERFYGQAAATTGEIEKTLQQFAFLINRTVYGDRKKIDDPQTLDLQKRMVEYIGTRLTLPIVLQHHIPQPEDHDGLEYRIAGSVGASEDSHLAFMMGHRKGAGDETEPSKVMHPVTHTNIQPKHETPTKDAASIILESEGDSPQESTDLELSVIAQDAHYRRALILMCGSGRHAIRLSDRVDEIVGVDISPECIEEAEARSNGHTNISYESADAVEYLSGNPEQFDLVTISGNSIIYLPPELQASVIARISESLVEGGEFVLDFVDIKKYGEYIDQHGSLFVDSTHIDRTPYIRTAHRRVEPSPKEGFHSIVSTLSYVRASEETMHSSYTRHAPSPEHMVTMLEQNQMQVEVVLPLKDEFYGPSMMLDRYLVRARKQSPSQSL